MSKRYKTIYNKYAGLVIADMSTNPRIGSAKIFSDGEIVDLLNHQDKKLTEIEEILNNFHVFFKQLPMGCASDISGAAYVMKKMYGTLGNIKKVVNDD